MKTEDWQILASLYNTKNLTKTARSLYLSQPALTARLHSIEEELGIEIAVRSNRGILFTPEGKYLAGNAAEILDHIDRVTEQAQMIRRRENAMINICANSTFTRYHLPEILFRYTETHPDTRFYIKVSASSGIRDFINTGVCDCGFMNGQPTGRLPGKKIVTQQAYIVSSQPITSREYLGDTPLIMHNTDIPTQRIINAWWKSCFSKKPEVIMDVTTLDTCLEMVMKGFGNAVVFGDFWSARYPKLYKEALFRDQDMPFTRDTWFIWCEDIPASPAADFVRFICDELDEDFFRTAREPGEYPGLSVLEE
ncbi:MAG: LysR family transcriptional regulator [Solobacterium sp.]|nr:LysR family transcriptional regulator [Solobacterium sp.]